VLKEEYDNEEVCDVSDVNQESKDSEPNENETDKDTVYGSNDNLELLLSEKESEEGKKEDAGLFRGLFSDYEEGGDEEDDEDDDESEEEEEDDEDDFTFGLKTFLKTEKERNKIKNEDKNRKQKSGLLKNLVACATLERVNTYQQPSRDEWVVDLELMGVRRSYRGHGLGKYLIGLVQSERVVGAFDCVTTASDADAVAFYEKYMFQSDPILNSKYAHIGDLWTNTTRLVYLPPYVCSSSSAASSGGEESDQAGYINELTLMERDFKRWQKIMFSSYQTQAQIFYKFKQEILALKAKLCAKNSLIEELKMRNDMLARKNRLLLLQQKQMHPGDLDNDIFKDEDYDGGVYVKNDEKGEIEKK
jgi:ribosomal protein S18 acetylase RimI-like enzyme